MTNVFSHGRLRLYLLRLLADSPRHGYELIRLLEDQFHGLYAPSAGTIYPRLARLEAEGLVTHDQQGGRKVYQITPAGRDELDRRVAELADLEAEIRASVRGMAEEIRAGVRGTARDLKGELKRAAREMRRQQRGWSGGRPGSEPGSAGPGAASASGSASGSASVEAWPAGTGDGEAARPGAPGHGSEPGPLLPRLHELVAQVAAAARGARPSEAQLRECLAILEEAFGRIRAVLRESRPPG